MPTDKIDYDTAKAYASSEDVAARTLIATRPESKPEILYYLTADPASPVRVALARNTSTPRQADAILSRDQAVEVRGELARKIARLVPDLSSDRLDQIGQLTLEILETLARDQAAAVRQTVAEALKDSDKVPKTVIDRLARDIELAVAEPVLRYSPLLTDEDLLEIIASSPVAGSLDAIAQRRQVREPVADAIAASDERSAITALLGNPSAQIREETLDRLIEKAPAIAEWHSPLVQRPSLSVGAIKRLALFVADTFLNLLSDRPEIDDETKRTIKATIRQNLENAETGSSAAKESPQATAKSGSAFLGKILGGKGLAGKIGKKPQKGKKAEADKASAKKGKTESYDEETMMLAFKRADYEYVRRGLAALNEVPQKIVEKILTSQSVRGVVALVWRSGLSMRFAMQVQKQIAHIPPRQVMNARSGFDYPMSDDEMFWQLEFFGFPKTLPKWRKPTEPPAATATPTPLTAPEPTARK